MDPLIGKKLGQCEIIDVLGQGGTATVYRAMQLPIRRTVAVKVLPELLATSERAMMLFRQEASVAAQLEHIRILPVYDYGEQDGVPYIVMRYIYGGSLRDLTTQGPLHPDTALHIVAQVAEALDYAHRRGVIHRDLKPSNILIDMDANVYLSDFGTAAVSYQTGLLSGVRTLGTPAYVAPEQASGGELGPAADVYSLGVTLFEMVTGQVPFPGASAAEQIRQHLEAEVPSVVTRNPTAHPLVDEVILRALAKAPQDRYESAYKFAAALADTIRVTGGWAIEEGMMPTPDYAGDTNLVAPGFSTPTPARVDVPPVPRTATRFATPASPYRPLLVSDDGDVFELLTGNTLIGRSDPRQGMFVDVDLSEIDTNRRSSRSHARILEGEDGYIVWDLHSLNGTYVNGRRLADGGRCAIADGDTLQFGRQGVRLYFQLG